MSRNAAIVKAYEAAAGRMPGVSLEQFSRALESAEVHPVSVDGGALYGIAASASKVVVRVSGREVV